MDNIPEYNTLREEIGRLQDQAARSLEVGILVTSGIYTISYSSIIGGEYQWASLISPIVLLIPFVYLIVDRVRTTWFIGRYIELYLEPKLGFHWEAFNRSLRGSPKGAVRSRFAHSSIIPLVGLQILSPILAFLVGMPSLWLWLGLMGFTLVIALIEIRWSRKYAIEQRVLDVMKEEIEKINKKSLDTNLED